MNAAPPAQDLSDLFDLFKAQAPGFERMDAGLDFCFPTERDLMSFHSWGCRLIQEAPADRALAFLTAAPWSAPAGEEGNQHRLQAAAEALGASLSHRVFQTGFGAPERELARAALSRLSAQPCESSARVAEAFLSGALQRCDVYCEEVHSYAVSLPGLISELGMAPGGEGRDVALAALSAGLSRGVDNAFLFEWSARQDPQSDWGQALRLLIAYAFEQSAWRMLDEFCQRFGEAAATRAQWDGREGVWEAQAARLARAMADSEGLMPPVQQEAARSGSLAPACLRSRPAFISALESAALESELSSAGPKRRSVL